MPEDLEERARHYFELHLEDSYVVACPFCSQQEQDIFGHVIQVHAGHCGFCLRAFADHDLDEQEACLEIWFRHLFRAQLLLNSSSENQESFVCEPLPE